MASETGPDLSAAVLAVEALMDDECTISGPDDPGPRQMGPDLRLAPAAPAGPSYSGRCKLKPLSSVSSQALEAGVSSDEEAYRLDLPLSAPPQPAGALALLTSSRRMPNAVGTSLELRQPVVKTLAVQASYVCVRKSRAE